MKKLFVLALLFLVACANPGSSVSLPEPTPTPSPSPSIAATILSTWINGPATIPALDFSQIQMNQIQSTDTVLSCPIPSGGDASGVDAPAGFEQVMKSQVYINGSSTFGIIQFGKQPHDHTQTGECYIVGQEAYYYSVVGATLTLCDITYKVCLTMERQ